MRRYIQIRPIHQFDVAATMAQAMRDQERLGRCGTLGAATARLETSGQ